MDKNENDQFLQKLLSTFKVEAGEHLRAISSGLIELEEAPAEKRDDILENVFREAHTLKGAARAVNVTDIERVCQSLESSFSTLKHRAVDPSRPLFDILHKAVDLLADLLASLEQERTGREESTIDELLRELERARAGSLPAQEEHEAPKTTAVPSLGKRERKAPAEDTVRVSLARLDSLLSQSEEMLSLKLLAEARSRHLRQMTRTLSQWKKRYAAIQPELHKVQRLAEDGAATEDLGSCSTKLCEFIDWNHAFLMSLDRSLSDRARSEDQEQRLVTTMVDRLQSDMRQILMFPFSSLFEILPKLVRDLSRDQGKDVQLQIQGSEIEIDRRILTEISDALIHLVRNCVDHGIEKPEERERREKPPTGVISLTVSQHNTHKIELIVSDDGSGINLAEVERAARKLHLLSGRDEKPNQDQLLALIFNSGLSTSPIVTDISGHGLGLAIVRDKVEKVGGSLSVETRPNFGTTFRILLPLTLATFRGVVVRVRDHHWVLPLANVHRVLRVSREEIKTLKNRETIGLADHVLPLVRLGAVFGLSEPSSDDGPAENRPVAVLQSGEELLAFAVDEILGEHEIMVKSLGDWVEGVPNLAGAAVLATGKVAPILKVSDLMSSATESSYQRKQISAEPVPERKRSILVVEDSITARTLLKSILEAVGYEVNTAVDGVDAMTTLRSGEFDLVVSDVDMPRMNGLDLTAKIRADEALADTPVVLVTALESREDRERGIDVGANAYIVKSSFDQSNLLEVIRRFL